MRNLRGIVGPILLGATLCVTAPALAGGVAVVETLITDNGDDDGFADTLETVSMQLVLQNTSGMQLTGVSLRLIAGSSPFGEPVAESGDQLLK